MKRTSSWLLAAVLIVASSSASLAASLTGWDGTWSGAWGGDPNQATSVTVAGNRVVSFSYQGYPHPVASSNVTATTITYQDQGNFVTLTKVSETTANAAMHSQGYDATAVLTRR
jgi:hypothetical protein